jgi:hypothetical protein
MESPKRSVRLELTERAAATLNELVDLHEEGIKDAQQATIEDRTLEKPEELLELSGGYADTLVDLEEIRRQLK